MRKNKVDLNHTEFSMLVLDDDKLMTLTLQSYFQASGYKVDIENCPDAAIERVRNGHYDILLLDFLMAPICGDQVVEEIRRFNQDLFIILLTGHKSMAPPIKTIRELDIQGYYEKSDRFDQLELLVESCGKSIRQMKTIRSYQEGLKRMLDALPEMYQMKSIDDIFEALMAGFTYLVGKRQGFLCVDSREIVDAREIEDVWGMADSRQPMDSMQAADREDGNEGEERFLIRETNLQRKLGREEIMSYLSSLQSGTLLYRDDIIVAALINDRQQVIGFLGSHLEKPLKDYQLQLFDLYAKQASSALVNAGLHNIVNRKNQELTLAYNQLKESHLEIVSAMRLIVDAKDIYTRGHSDRVSYYAYRIAKGMGSDAEYCQRVRVAGLFHDIGKLGIADEILLSPNRLTDEQRQAIQQHPANGYNILSAISLFRDVVPAVRGHHERFDGSGYPDGLAGEDIPEIARIISVADAFDAMTSDRHYRSSLGEEKAIQQLQEGREAQFDPKMVDVFLELLKDYDSLKADVAWTHSADNSIQREYDF